MVWHKLGYPYHIGGTNYVITPPSAGTEGRSDESTATVLPRSVFVDIDADAAETYAQIQELIELVHEWRTMNESPSLHERLGSWRESPGSHPLLAAIREKNQAFDEATRAAMVKLARRESAASEVQSAREHLETLIEQVDSLPARGQE